MTRIYASAKTLIAEHGLDPEKIKGMGTGGAITKMDVEKAIKAGAGTKVRGNRKKGQKGRSRRREGRPSQHDIIREGLVHGLSNAEIVEAVLRVHRKSKVKPEDVSWTQGNERRKGSAWREVQVRQRERRVGSGPETAT